MTISSSSPISPVALVKAGWLSFRQNMGTFLLAMLASVGIYLLTIVIYVILLMILGQSSAGMVIMGLLYFLLLLGLAGYFILAQTRLSYLGSAGSHVPLQEVMAWNTSLVGRMLGVLILVAIAIFLVGSVIVLVAGLPMMMTVGRGGNLSVGVGILWLGYAVFIGVAIFLQTVFSQGTFLVLQGQSVITALQMSMKMTAGSRWRIVGLLLLIGLLGLGSYLPAFLPLVLVFFGIADPGLQMIVSLLAFAGLLVSIVCLVVVSGVSIFAQGHLFRALAARK